MLERIASLQGIIQFASGQYLVFLALVVVVYFMLPGARTRAAWLLAVSAGFYLLLSPRTLVVLLVVAAVSYAAGIAMGAAEKAADERSRQARRRAIATSAVLALVGSLVAFKYLGFIATIGNSALTALGRSASLPLLKFALPLGISFWTFQTVAYVVDVYKRKTPPERNPFYFLLAVMFFPVVTAGPITRVQALVQQLKVRRRFDYAGMQSGLLLIGRGFLKKLMVADRLVVFVNSVFDRPQAFTAERNGVIFVIGAVFFALQLYFDFSAYTDIVRGSARLFGVELPLNFRAPYFARTVKDFWRRWHVTLMDWLKEYVYIPLGGNRKGKARRLVNLLVVFAVSGLWHGAGLTYLAWGLLNGMYQVMGELLAPVNQWISRLLRVDRDSFGHRVFQTVVTFSLITIAWVFFRANTFGDAIYILRNMISPSLWVLTDGTIWNQGLTPIELMIAVSSAVVLLGIEWLSLRKDLLLALNRQHLLFRWAVYYAVILTLVIFGAYGGTYNAADFVYFKF